MPIARFQMSDGRVARFEVPDGTTPDQANTMMQAHFAPPAQATTPAGIPLDPGAAERMAAESAAKPVQAPDGWGGKIAGALEVPLSMATGIVGGLAGAIRGGPLAIPFSKAKDAKALEEEGGKLAEALTYQPRTQTGQELLGTVGNAINNSGIIGLPIGPEMMAATRMAAPAARQAGAAVKAATAPEVFMAKNAARKIASISMLPKVNQETAQLASRAQQFGMKLTPDMLSGNKIARITGEAAAKVPFSGAPGEANQVAFNRSLIKMIGGDEAAHAMTPDIFGDALLSNGEKIGEISGRTHIPMNDSFAQALANHVDEAAKFQTEGNANILNSYVRELQNKAAQNGGVIDGTAFRTLNSKIGRQIRGTTDGDLKNTLGDLQGSMFDALQANIAHPDDLAALMDARRKYAIAKTIEPLVAKSPTGDISPAGLMGRVTADGSGKTRMATGNGGDLGDLARVGQRFLKEPGSSNTAERGLAYTIMGGGALANLPVTAGVVTGANLYNRLSPLLANRIIAKSLPPKVLPVRFANELALAEESPFRPRPAPEPAPYNGLLTLADEGDLASRAPVPDTQRLATRHDHPTIDFPLRQEILQQPEIAGAVNDFRAEAARLTRIKDNAISPKVAAKAANDLAKLQAEFAAGMDQLGISNAADAHGLNRPLYQTGAGTRLPIQKTGRNITPLDKLPRKRQ
jgi:hypothetical protein